MEEYIPKSKVLELWRYWKFIEAYDQTKAMKGIGIDRLDDGTLVVAVDDATKVTRVLVEDEQKNGCLYYADQPQGEWKEKTTFHNADDNPIIEEWQSARCSVCGKYHTTPYMYYFNDFAYCPSCGAKMKGADDE